MKRTIIIWCFLIMGLAFPMQARTFKGLSVGANAAYTNDSKWGAETFAQANLQFGQIPFEPKLGFTYRTFATDYKELNNLGIESIGIFAEGDIYPFKKFFYAGGRLEMDANWFNDKAMNLLDNANEPVLRTFPGFRFYAVTGFDIPMNQRISLRISVMPGWQFYVISDNWKISSGGSGINMYSNDGVSYNRFVFQVNVGLAIRLWNK